MIIFSRVKFFVFVFLLISGVMVSHAEETKEPFAVLELFTSEGCSSCPPADRLLSEMVQQARSSNPRIIPLEFHVDYWNYLGWVDPFSERRFSQRQREYGQAFQSSTVYTPQVIVNGKEEFGGYR